MVVAVLFSFSAAASVFSVFLFLVVFVFSFSLVFPAFSAARFVLTHSHTLAHTQTSSLSLLALIGFN